MRHERMALVLQCLHCPHRLPDLSERRWPARAPEIVSGGRKPDRRVYFVWGRPDYVYGTEAEARAALAAQEDKP